MRGQLPIIIALIILLGLIISSLFYITAITTYTKSLSSGPVKNIWDIIDQELDTLNLVALKYASHKAYEVFKETFHTSYREVNYTLVLEKRTAKYYYDFSINDTSYLIFPTNTVYELNKSEGALILKLNNTGKNEFPYAVAYIDDKNLGNNVYVAFRGTADEFIGWLQLDIKGINIESAYVLGENKTNKKLEAYYILNNIPLNLSSTSSVSHPYVYFGTYSLSLFSQTFSLKVYDVQNKNWSNLTYTGTDLGILKNPYYGVGGKSVVKIYKLLLSDSRDLKYVYVSGLKPGWRAVVTNGSISYEGVADSNGVAKIFFPDLIFRNATIKIYDDKGSLCIAKNFSLIVGGDYYVYKDNFGYPEYNYAQVLANFTHALNVSCEKALGVLRENVLKVIYNWIYYKIYDGYSVNIIYFKPFYNVTIWMDGYREGFKGTYRVSCGRGSIGFYVNYLVRSPEGEMREFVKSINASYIISYIHGYPYAIRNMTLPFMFRAILTINGHTYSYMQPNTLLWIRIYSVLFQKLPAFNVSSNGRRYIDMIPVRTFYTTNSTVKAYYKLKHGTGPEIAVEQLCFEIRDILIYEYGFPNEYYFLWATISSINMDGIIVPSAVKLVFIYRYEVIWWWEIWYLGICGDTSCPLW